MGQPPLTLESTMPSASAISWITVSLTRGSPSSMSKVTFERGSAFHGAS